MAIPTDPTLTRRQALNLFSAAGTAAVLGYGRAVRAATDCSVSPEKTIGPYFVEELLERSDIRADPSTGTVQTGVPLRLNINVLQADAACAPGVGVQVDVWHAGAAGLYSDEAANGTSGKKYLRGYQVTDTNGAVSFITVYPGWYSGRTIHIHFRVRAFSGSQTVFDFISQIFFDETTNNAVLAQSPYNSRGTRDKTNAADNIYSAALLATMVSDGSGGYVATMNVGISGLPAGSGSTTTTTTLPASGCSSEFTFDATLCQAAALGTTVTTLLADSLLRRRLLRTVENRIRALVDRAQAAVAAEKTKRAARLLRRASHGLLVFENILGSKLAQQNATTVTVAALDALAQALVVQVEGLSQTLA